MGSAAAADRSGTTSDTSIRPRAEPASRHRISKGGYLRTLLIQVAKVLLMRPHNWPRLALSAQLRRADCTGENWPFLWPTRIARSVLRNEKAFEMPMRLKRSNRLTRFAIEACAEPIESRTRNLVPLNLLAIFPLMRSKVRAYYIGAKLNAVKGGSIPRSRQPGGRQLPSEYSAARRSRSPSVPFASHR